jgi:hypothetical protein
VPRHLAPGEYGVRPTHGHAADSAYEDAEIRFVLVDVRPGVHWHPSPVTVEAGDAIDLHLTDDERALLRAGLLEWRGPARVTQELAVGMGFRDQQDLFDDGNRLRLALEAHAPLAPRDWARTVLATEIVFASDLVGSGVEWSITTGYGDADTIALLRQIQRQLPRRVRAVIGSQLGTRPPGRPPR